MCGIIGIFTSEATTYTRPLIKTFKQGLFADTFRGEDSTGIAVMNKEMNQPEVFKKALAAPDFLQLDRTNELLDPKYAQTFLLGHNRAATKGGVEHRTAHPFQIGDITLVHNGTVNNHRDLTDGNKFTVDSEAICHAINVDGIEKVVKTLTGAFTLVWHDARDDSLNIIRNEERPLWMSQSFTDTLLIASEGAMLHWVAGRNEVKLDKLFQPTAGMYYQYFIGTKDWASKPHVKPLALAPKSTVTYGLGYQGNTGKVTNINTTTKTMVEICDGILNATKNKFGHWETLVEPLRFEAYPAARNGMGKIFFKLVGGDEEDAELVMHSATSSTYESFKDSVVLTRVLSATYPSNVVDPPKVTLCGYNSSITIIPNTTSNRSLKKPLSTSQQTVKSASGNTEEDIEFETFEGPGGKYYGVSDIFRFIANGCGYCAGDISLKDIDEGRVEWTVTGNTPICEDCVERVKDLGQYVDDTLRVH